MIPLRLILLFLLIMPLSGAKADEIQNLTNKFSNGEMSRNDYLDRLFELRAKIVESEFGKGNAISDSKIAEIDGQIKRYPLPTSSVGETLSRLRVGIWQAARHTSLFRPDHTWVMLPIVDGYDPQGLWRIEGNRYYETAQDYSPEKLEGIIILLDSRYFIMRIGNQLFYEKRLKEYHGE